MSYFLLSLFLLERLRSPRSCDAPSRRPHESTRSSESAAHSRVSAQTFGSILCCLLQLQQRSLSSPRRLPSFSLSLSPSLSGKENDYSPYHVSLYSLFPSLYIYTYIRRKNFLRNDVTVRETPLYPFLSPLCVRTRAATCLCSLFFCILYEGCL